MDFDNFILSAYTVHTPSSTRSPHSSLRRLRGRLWPPWRLRAQCPRRSTPARPSGMPRHISTNMPPCGPPSAVDIGVRRWVTSNGWRGLVSWNTKATPSMIIKGRLIFWLMRVVPYFTRFCLLVSLICPLNLKMTQFMLREKSNNRLPTPYLLYLRSWETTNHWVN